MPSTNLKEWAWKILLIDCKTPLKCLFSEPWGTVITAFGCQLRFCLYDLVVFWKFTKALLHPFQGRLLYTYTCTHPSTHNDIYCTQCSLWLENNENDSHNHPQNESDYFIITPALCVHAPCHWLLIKEIQKWFEKLAWSSKNCAMKWKKKHILWGPQFIYVPLAKWFNLLDSVLAHIKWRKFYINCETGARIKENNLQESACYVLSP